VLEAALQQPCRHQGQRRREGGAPGTRAEISLQPLDKTMVK